MRKIYLLFLLQIFFLVLKAQDSTFRCATADMDTTEFKQLPWFDNNQVLSDFLDSIGYPSAGSRIMDGNIKYWIPIKFWIYRDNAGNGGPTLRQIQNMMDNLNRLYNQVNNTWIGFYMKCEPTYINNTGTRKNAFGLIATNRDLGCINVHVVDQISGGTAVGYTIPPFNGSVIDKTSYNGFIPTSTLAHEIGHVLGLLHTHLFSNWHWKCLTESVSRTRTWPFFNLCPTAIRTKKVCESTGDALSDTPADPNLTGNFSCFYTLGGSDPWGDSYPSSGADAPETANIMSYNTNDNCINHFSRLQIAVMLRTLKWSKIDNGYWKDSKYTFDSYEPDNSADIARPIILNEIQEHNFNQQYNNNGGIPNTTQCDVDWVRFTPTCSGSFTVETSAMSGRTNANTRVTLFDNGLTQLAQNDDISSSNQFSSVGYNFVSGNTYFIRVENMSNGVTGYYQLTVKYVPTISGDNNFCTTSNNYTIANLPAGATVQWSATPSGIVTVNSPNSPQTTLTKITNGTVTLTATIFNACGGTSSAVSKRIDVGSIPVDAISITLPFGDPNNLECNTIYKASGSVSLSYQPTAYRWTINPEWSIITNPANASINFAPNANASLNGYLGLSVQNACGWSAEQVLFMQVNCAGGYSMKLSPNPASSTLTIETTDNRKFTKLRIIDKMGEVRKQLNYTASKKITINVSDLPSDVYRIQALVNNNWITLSFIKR